MARTNVYRYATEHEQYSDPDARDRIAGWFDPDAATAFGAETVWNGHNRVDINAGEHRHHVLYRTHGGRWVLHTWSQWEGSRPTYEFVDEETAREWLIKNEHDDAVAEHFGPLDEEAGPNLGGRPEIGPAINIRFPAETIARLDALAAAHDWTRAGLIRRYVEEGLKSESWA